MNKRALDIKRIRFSFLLSKALTYTQLYEFSLRWKPTHSGFKEDIVGAPRRILGSHLGKELK